MHADLLIVTVTRPESLAVLKVFQDATGQVPQPQPIGKKLYHDLGIVNNTAVCMVQSEMGSIGLGAALQTVDRGTAALSPSAVIMVGIAFGIDSEKQHLGDILVSQRLALYECQCVGTSKEGDITFLWRGDRPHASSWLLNRFKSADLYWHESGIDVRFGLILSGEKLVDNVDFRQQLRAFEPEAIGGEMEGAGLYVACQDRKVDWILVKSICDWADGQKSHDKDSRQCMAAHNAARFVLHVLSQGPLTEAVRPAESSRQSIFDKLLLHHAKRFGGRAELLKEIETFTVTSGGYRLFEADAGMGKTALMAYVVQHPPQATRIVFHFFSKTFAPSALDEGAFLRSVILQINPDDDIAAHPGTQLLPLHIRYNRLLESLSGQRTLFLIDVLDEAHFNVGNYLPESCPKGFHVILTARPVLDRNWPHYLQLPQLVEWDWPPLSEEDIAAILTTSESTAHILSDESDSVRQILRITERLPFHLRYLLDDIEKGTISVRDLTKHPSGLDSYLDAWWKGITEGGPRTGPISNILLTLVGAFGPLARGDIFTLHPNLSLEAFDQMGRWIVGDDANGYSICHKRLAEYVARKAGAARCDLAEQRLVDYCEQWKTNGSSYAISHYLSHLLKLDRYAEACALIESHAWCQQKQERDPGGTSLAADIERILNLAEQRQDVPRIAAYSLLLARVFKSLPFELLEAMINLGRTRQALRCAQMIKDPLRFLMTLYKLFISVVQMGDYKNARIGENDWSDSIVESSLKAAKKGHDGTKPDEARDDFLKKWAEGLIATQKAAKASEIAANITDERVRSAVMNRINTKAAIHEESSVPAAMPLPEILDLDMARDRAIGLCQQAAKLLKEGDEVAGKNAITEAFECARALAKEIDRLGLLDLVITTSVENGQATPLYEICDQLTDGPTTAFLRCSFFRALESCGVPDYNFAHVVGWCGASIARVTKDLYHAPLCMLILGRTIEKSGKEEKLVSDLGQSPANGIAMGGLNMLATLLSRDKDIGLLRAWNVMRMAAGLGIFPYRVVPQIQRLNLPQMWEWFKAQEQKLREVEPQESTIALFSESLRSSRYDTPTAVWHDIARSTDLLFGIGMIDEVWNRLRVAESLSAKLSMDSQIGMSA